MLSQSKTEDRSTYLILHNIRSVHNVGSIFRTAEAASVDKVFLTGYTALPVDRFNRFRRDISKTALGAEKSVPWKGVKNISTLLGRLSKEGFEIVALEQSGRSLDYKSYTVKDRTVFIVGNEVNGLSTTTLSKCDTVIEIPMLGEKESLNVSVACGIMLFRVLDI